LTAYDLPEGTGVILTPSGSDAEYFPLLFQRLLNPESSILNLVACNEEVGSGTLNASGGKFFSPVEPILGYTNGEKKDGDEVEGLCSKVETLAIQARVPSGDVVALEEQIPGLLDKCRAEGKVPILHTVFGSKTGIT